MKLAKSGDVDFDSQIDILVSICNLSVPEITRDLLENSLDISEINELFEYIMQPVLEKATNSKAKTEGKTSKNP